MKATQEIQRAYAHCRNIARNHYENFPVASRFMPRNLRPAVTVIYAFARSADDFADEGAAPAAQRLAQLQQYEHYLHKIAQHEPIDDLIFIALQDVVNHYALPLEPFYRLLHAFKQDITKQRYANFGEVMDYCRNSANPVGELLLYLYGQATEQNLGYSNAICTALQLINFLQDLYQDYTENNRIYIPQDEMQRHRVSEQHFAQQITDPAMRGLMLQQIERARKLLQAGAPLGLRLTGRLGFELRLIITGGARILKHLHHNQTDVFARPRLRSRDWLVMLGTALWPRLLQRRGKSGSSGCGIC